LQQVQPLKEQLARIMYPSDDFEELDDEEEEESDEEFECDRTFPFFLALTSYFSIIECSKSELLI
jgi:hypothetical protein